MPERRKIEITIAETIAIDNLAKVSVEVESSDGIRVFFWSVAIEDEKPLNTAPSTPERMTANQSHRVDKGLFTTSATFDAAATDFTTGESGGRASQSPIAIKLMKVKSRNLDLWIASL